MVSLLCSQQLVKQDLNNNINLRLNIHIQNDKLKSMKLIIIWKDVISNLLFLVCCKASLLEDLSRSVVDVTEAVRTKVYASEPPTHNHHHIHHIHYLATTSFKLDFKLQLTEKDLILTLKLVKQKAYFYFYKLTVQHNISLT